MPTGYTAILQDNPDLPFPEFAKRCARAFGACIMQRDEPMDSEIVMDEERSDYHERAKETAINDLRDAQERTQDGWRMMLSQDIESAKARQAEAKAKRDGHRKAYMRMLNSVMQWTPPTPDHNGLRDFMAEQLRSSIKWDCSNEYHDEEVRGLEAMTWDQYRDKVIADCEWEVSHHTKEHSEEVARVKQRNEWKRQLIESLPQ